MRKISRTDDNKDNKDKFIDDIIICVVAHHISLLSFIIIFIKKLRSIPSAYYLKSLLIYSIFHHYDIHSKIGHKFFTRNELN